jgi:hypothetical protein
MNTKGAYIKEKVGIKRKKEKKIGNGNVKTTTTMIHSFMQTRFPA